MRYALLLLAAFVLPAHAEGLNLDPWTTGDTVRQSVVTALLVADWKQTLYIAQHPQDPVKSDGTYHYRSETNRLLGSHPSTGKINAYFVGVTVAHAAISYVLPRGWREGWQYVWIGVELETVRRNYIGIKYGF